MLQKCHSQRHNSNTSVTEAVWWVDQVRLVAAGSASTLLLNDAFELHGCGKNNAGQLGLPRSKVPVLSYHIY
jgi:alpha-tubulin suppressor-like RCC1 family protein